MNRANEVCMIIDRKEVLQYDRNETLERKR